jgi:hypothetical protein
LARPISRAADAVPRTGSRRHRAPAANPCTLAHPGTRHPPEGPYSICYAVSTLRRSTRSVLSLRIPSSALSRLPRVPRSGPTAITCRAVPATR